MNWANWLWGRTASAIAAVGLAIAGLWDDVDRPWALILIFAGFLIIHASINSVRDKKLSIVLGRNYASVQGRILRLLADLAEITAGGYELWKVDVYFPEKRFSRSSLWFRSAKLSLELSVSLTDIRPAPVNIEPDDRFFWECFRTARNKLWWDPSLVQTSNGGNFFSELDDASNERLKKYCGVVGAHPIVNHLGKDCCGLLVVHTRRDPEMAVKALGALQSSESTRRLNEACKDVHEKLQR